MFLAVLFRKSGAAIAVFFLYGLIFEWLITLLLNVQIGISPIGYFLPLQITDVMLPLPFGGKLLYADSPEPWIAAIAGVAYIFVYYIFALKKFNKDDL